MATAFTGHDGALCTNWAYHGITEATVALSPESAAPAGHLPRHVERWHPPDPFRHLHTGDQEFVAARHRLEAKGYTLAATILDGCLASEMISDLEPSYCQALVSHTRAAGGLWIADEVQSGHGRTGSHMWCYQRWGITPDFVTMGKPMGNGVPIAAVITRRKIADKFVQKHGVFFSTFGGNPVCVAAAHAVLDVLQDTHVLARTAHAGEALRAAMSVTTAAAALPSHVRGVGLMNCLELVTDHESQRPNTQLASCLKNALRRRGVLVGTTGQHSNMLKIRPPLAFTAAEVPVFAEALAAAIEECKNLHAKSRL